MKHLFPYIIFSILVFFVVAPFNSRAQFKEEAFTQSYNDDADTTGRDSTDQAFTFKEFFGGVKHQRECRIGVLFAGSTVFVGCEQMYNKDYWKLPVIYGGIASTVSMGIYYRHKYNVDGNSNYKTASTLLFTGAGLIYWGTLLDGVVNYNRDTYPHPGKATLYSALLPGLGQIYNGDYWKLPIYYGLMAGSAHFMVQNNTNYRRYKRIYREATTNEAYDGPVSASTAKYYRDVFRRYRDYSVVALFASYVLQIIDANVFAYMHDFELSDDLSMSVSPTVMSPDCNYALVGTPGVTSTSLSGSSLTGGNEALGLRVGIRF